MARACAVCMSACNFYIRRSRFRPRQVLEKSADEVFLITLCCRFVGVAVAWLLLPRRFCAYRIYAVPGISSSLNSDTGTVLSLNGSISKGPIGGTALYLSAVSEPDEHIAPNGEIVDNAANVIGPMNFLFEYEFSVVSSAAKTRAVELSRPKRVDQDRLQILAPRSLSARRRVGISSANKAALAKHESSEVFTDC